MPFVKGEKVKPFTVGDATPPRAIRQRQLEGGSIHIGTRLSGNIARMVDEVCEEEDMTKSEFFRRVIIAELNRREFARKNAEDGAY